MSKNNIAILVICLITLIAGAFILTSGDSKEVKEIKFAFTYGEQLSSDKLPEEVSTIAQVYTNEKGLFYPNVVIERLDLNINQRRVEVVNISKPKQKEEALRSQVSDIYATQLPNGLLLKATGDFYKEESSSNNVTFYIVSEGDNREDNVTYFSKAENLRKKLIDAINNEEINTTEAIKIHVLPSSTAETSTTPIEEELEIEVIENTEPIADESNDIDRVDTPIKEIELIKEKTATTKSEPKPISINLKHEGGNVVSWNPEINESNINLTYEFNWSEGPDEPTRHEKVHRTIHKGDQSYLNGQYTICPETNTERKLHGAKITVTLSSKLNNKSITKSIVIAKNNFTCKCH